MAEIHKTLVVITHLYMHWTHFTLHVSHSATSFPLKWSFNK